MSRALESSSLGSAGPLGQTSATPETGGATANPVVLLRIDRAADRHTRHPRHLFPPLDLKIVQAALAAQLGAPVPLIDGWLAPFDVAAFAAQALALQPRIAVLRAVSWCIEESVATARLLRAAGVLTIAVGQQAQHAARCRPAGWDEAFDLSVAGEPEAIVPEIVAALLGGTPREILQTRLAARALHLVEQPDALPLPQFSAGELDAYPFPFALRGAPVSRWGYLLTAWGCPRPCRHCTSIVRKSVGRPLRTRSLAGVLDEVARLADAGADAIAFEDDSLFVHRQRFLELADGLVRRSLVLPWMANARPDELDDGCIAAARESGARLLKVGIDSGSPRLVEAIGKAPDGAAWVGASRSAFARLDAAGIGSVALFVVGLPGETSADARASYALARGLPADYLQVQLYRPYPDVALWPQLPVAQRIVGGEYHYDGHGGDCLTNCSALADDELAAWPRRFYRGFYLRPGFVLRHLQRSWRHYLPRRRGPTGTREALDFLLRRG
jgi:anaerobic magnesium-protoporphyrin IX monomethyl ester cyclase